jgi:hypothetical protein
MERPIIWTLPEAITVIQAYQSTFRAYSYHVGICGGVINNGNSRKDLDLLVCRLQTKEEGCHFRELLEGWLKKEFHAKQVDFDEYQYITFRLYKGNLHGKPIDFMIYE